MKEFEQFIKGKKVTVMGLGLLGRAVGDAKFLAECGAEVTVTDIKTEADLAKSVEILKPFSNITFALGGHREKDFSNADLVLRAPNAPLDSPYLQAAREAGVRITQSSALFAEYADIDIIGVTGTRGKSTTTHFIHHTLMQAGHTVLLGGNVQGVSTLSLLRNVEQYTAAVLELDSWQLQSFGTEKISPHIAVFTTFMRDHMNYYKGDIDRYLNDKAQIFLHQTKDDTLVVGEDAHDMIAETYGDRIQSHIVQAERSLVPDTWERQVPGEHNRLNLACGVATLRAYGLSREEIEKGVETFVGVPGRLQFVRDINGVKIYNDTTATTPDAAIAALEALDTGNKNIVLIAGGADKELDMREFVREAQERTKKVILLAGTGTDNIKDLLPDAPVHDSLEPAVGDAFREAREGDVILFSPAFASFGMFTHEYERGEQFERIIKNSAHHTKVAGMTN